MNVSVQPTYFTGSLHLFESISCYPTLALELKLLQIADFFFAVKLAIFYFRRQKERKEIKAGQLLLKKTNQTSKHFNTFAFLRESGTEMVRNTLTRR